MNLEESLDKQFSLITESYKKSLLANNILQDEELASELVELFFETCIKNGCKYFILNTQDINMHFENLKLLYESIEVLELETEEVNDLVKAYTIFSFRGDFQLFLRGLDKDRLLENLEKAKVELDKINIENNVYKNLNSLINILG